MKPTDVSRIVGYVATTWPNFQPVTKEVIGVWDEYLGAFDYPIVLSVLRKEGRAGRLFAPGPGEVAHLVTQVLIDAPTPDEAWEEVARNRRERGRGWIPQWSHTTITETVKNFGGWYHLCSVEDDGHDRRQWMDMYRQITARQEADSHSDEVLDAIRGSNAPELPRPRVFPVGEIEAAPLTPAAFHEHITELVDRLKERGGLIRPSPYDPPPLGESDLT